MSLTTLHFVVATLFVVFVSPEMIRYDNYRVYEILPKTQKSYDFLRQLDGTIDGVLFLNGIPGVGIKSYAIASPAAVPKLLKYFQEGYITFLLVSNNAQEGLDREMDTISRRASGAYDWNNYYTLEDTYAWMKKTAATNKYASIVKVGETFQGRQILGLKVSFQGLRPSVFIEGGLHGREWLSPAVVTYLANEILENNSSRIRDVANKLDWIFVPITNPDGYEYTHNQNRLWRKTRSRFGNCIGADLNRNFGDHWNTTGKRFHPCSDVYPGPFQFSEIESRSIASFVRSLTQKRFRGYISIQAYGQFLLFPYGYKKERIPDYDQLQSMAEKGAKALAARHGSNFTIGSIAETFLPISGDTVDWAYDTASARFAFSYSLRPKVGTWDGFIRPPEDIILSGEETLDSLIALLTEAARLNYFE